MSTGSGTRTARRWRAGAGALTASVALTACSAAAGSTPASDGTAFDSWDEVLEEARGQEVALWMWGGDERGNAYVDDVLAPAAAQLGVTLRRVPVADTADALNRALSELQAGTDDGAVDLVWVNGENFRTGQAAELWACGWTDLLPNAQYLDPDDPLLEEDFGTAVEGCESPWHKAQFVLAYDAADVADPPRTLAELERWIRANPGRFTYPAPPDFTGSAFLRQVTHDVASDAGGVPDADDEAAGALTDDVMERLAGLAPSLWRNGDTYPRDVSALDQLFAGDQVSFTMTYGPATMDALVADGTFPATTRVLPLEGGTIGNASFLAVPRTSPDQAAAMVVADLALSPEQQLAKADPATWGQYTVLDLDRVPSEVAEGFAALPTSPVVPPFEVLSDAALPELSPAWVTSLEDAWRARVLPGQG